MNKVKSFLSDRRQIFGGILSTGTRQHETNRPFSFPDQQLRGRED
jgi:hypothetical protein